MKYAPKLKRRRVGFIDELRGLDILAMVAYHAMYDLVYIFGINIPLFRVVFMPYVQPVIAIVFIVLSGISCRYSRNNLKRGAKTLLLGMLLTAVTLFIPGQAIYFGILHFMGTSMILFALLRPALDLLPPLIGAIISTALYLLTYRLPDGYLSFAGLFNISLPASLYERSYLLPIGFAGAGSDYFPLMPWLFLYFAGAYIGIFFLRNSFPEWFYRTHSKALSKIGSHTIVIYLLHQPIIMGAIWIVLWISDKF